MIYVIHAHMFNASDFCLFFSDSNDDEELLFSAWDQAKDALVVSHCKTCHFQ